MEPCKGRNKKRTKTWSVNAIAIDTTTASCSTILPRRDDDDGNHASWSTPSIYLCLPNHISCTSLMLNIFALHTSLQGFPDDALSTEKDLASA